jgi:major membrane immunogen (membrane-anchored lipoprotein)
MLNKSSHTKPIKKVSYLILFILIQVIILTSCSQKELINDPLTGEISPIDRDYILVDGYYSGSTYFYNARGFAQQLDIIVKNSIITKVVFTETGLDGLNRISEHNPIQSWDSLETKDLTSLYFHLNNTFLLTQNPDKIQAISGATETTNRYTLLANSLISQAKTGNYEPLKISTNDIYTITSKTDSSGYQGILTATYAGPNLVALSYDEIQTSNGKQKSKLSETEEIPPYQSIFDSFSLSTLKSNTLSYTPIGAEATPEETKYRETLEILKDYRISF